MNKYLLILLMLASSSTFAALNKWVDEAGNLHYSDTPPPPNAEVKKMHTDSHAPSGAGETAAASAPMVTKTIAEQEAELKKAQKAKEDAADKAAKEQAKAETLKTNCANAQQSLRSLQSGGRMVEIDANGEQSFISDEQRQKRIAKTQQDISTYCK